MARALPPGTTAYVRRIFGLSIAVVTASFPRFPPNAIDRSIVVTRVSDRYPSRAKTPRRLRERRHGANRAGSKGDAMKTKGLFTARGCFVSFFSILLVGSSLQLLPSRRRPLSTGFRRMRANYATAQECGDLPSSPTGSSRFDRVRTPAGPSDGHRECGDTFKRKVLELKHDKDWSMGGVCLGRAPRTPELPG
jgi:hypothetical protein